MERLWAPWRLEYIQTADEQPGCVFCRAAGLGDEDGLIVHRGGRAFVEMMRNLDLSMPTHITEALRTNMSGGKTVAQLLAEGMGLSSNGTMDVDLAKLKDAKLKGELESRTRKGS